ncbi:MAG: helix-hairpin-helix domain-containing protein [Coriobacteriales bacterium]|nr:helix-hairpin-helix domain-containing protein [Coriobacteriales bacterium]
MTDKKSPLWGMLPRVNVQVRDRKLVVAVLVALALIAAGYGAWAFYNTSVAEEEPTEVAAEEAADTNTAGEAAGTNTAEEGTGTAGGAPQEGSTAEDDWPLDLNTANARDLQRLPNIGPVLAERILAWRTEHGRFTDTEELMLIEGIGERTYERLKELVVVGAG